jgi:hypothetical protein
LAFGADVSPYEDVILTPWETWNFLRERDLKSTHDFQKPVRLQYEPLWELSCACCRNINLFALAGAGEYNCAK